MQKVLVRTCSFWQMKQKQQPPRPTRQVLDSTRHVIRIISPPPLNSDAAAAAAASSSANPLKRETENHFKVLQVFGLIYSSQCNSQH